MRLYRWSPTSYSWSQASLTAVGPSGEFSFSSLDPGTFYSFLLIPSVSVPIAQRPPRQFLGGRELVRGGFASLQSFKAVAGSQTQNFALDGGVSVKGKIQIPAGQPLPVDVWLTRPVYQVVAGVRTRHSTEYDLRVDTSADGSFEFPHVLPGYEYTVRVRGFVSSPHEPVTLRSPYSDRASAALRHLGAATDPRGATYFKVGSGIATLPAFEILDDDWEFEISPVTHIGGGLRGVPTVGSTLSVRNVGGGLGLRSQNVGATEGGATVRELVPRALRDAEGGQDAQGL